MAIWVTNKDTKIGIGIKHQHQDSVEMDSADIPIVFKEAKNVASLSMGYSPMMSFEVVNLDAAVGEALRQGGLLDGPIKYPLYGKFAAVRSPDGLSIGLIEPAALQDVP
eukprot:gene4925-9824_t